MTMDKKYLSRLARAVYVRAGVPIEGEVKAQLAAWVRGTANAVFESWPEAMLIWQLEGMAEGDLAMQLANGGASR